MESKVEYLKRYIKWFGILVLCYSCSSDHEGTIPNKIDSVQVLVPDTPKMIGNTIDTTITASLIGKLIENFEDTTLLKLVYGSYIRTKKKFFWDYSEYLDTPIVVHRYTYGPSYNRDTVDVEYQGVFGISDSISVVFFNGDVTDQMHHRYSTKTELLCVKRNEKWYVKDYLFDETVIDEKEDEDGYTVAAKAKGYVLLKDRTYSNYGDGVSSCTQEYVGFRAYGNCCLKKVPGVRFEILGWCDYGGDGSGFSIKTTYSMNFIKEWNCFKFTDTITEIITKDTVKGKEINIFSINTYYLNDKAMVTSYSYMDSACIKKTKVRLKKDEIKRLLQIQ